MKGQQDTSWLSLCSPHGDTRKDCGHETNEFRSPPQQKGHSWTPCLPILSISASWQQQKGEFSFLSWTWICLLIPLLLLTTNSRARDSNPKLKFLRFAVSHWVDEEKELHFSFLKFRWKYRGNITRKKNFKKPFFLQSKCPRISCYVPVSLCPWGSYSRGIQDHVCVFLWPHREVSTLKQAPTGIGAAQRELLRKAVMFQVSGSNMDLNNV